MRPAHARRSALSVAGALAILAGLLPVAAPSVLAASPDVVISEFRVRGPNGGSDEFIELYNRSGAAVAIGGWKINGSNSSGTTSTRVTITAATSLGAGCHYLVTNSSTSGGPYSGSVAGNQTYATGITDDGGIAVLTAANAIVDQVGLSTGSAYREGTNLASLGSSNLDRGYERKPGGAAGSGTDTDDNASDFAVRTPSDPQNLDSPCSGSDAAPTVSSSPADGATGVAVGTSITLTFSEPVDVTDPWFEISCSISGDHAATVSGGPTTYTLDPATNFVDGDACTVTVFAAGVSDQDGNDPPDNLTADFEVGFSAEDVCTHSYTPIPDIQGSGPNAAITGTVTTAGVVVGDFEGTAAVSGFYLQDPAGDGDPATSDGIYVFTGNANLVTAGEFVRVTGFARERFNQTTINGSNRNTSAVPAANVVDCGDGPAVTPTEVMLPFATAGTPEQYEGMLVTFPQDLVISEYFNYDRFGEIVLAKPLDDEDRPYTGTAVDPPGDAANARTAANALSRITLDDDVSAQNPAVLRHPNGEPFSLTNRFRGGDLVTNTTGVLGFDFSLYRIYPTEGADYTAVNTRPAAPENVGGSIRAAAMNTLNFFLTLDTTTSDTGPGPCGGNANLDCRGADADQPDEFDRQRTKLLQALSGLDADVIGLNELENTPGVEPLLDPERGVVAGLNALPAADGPYDAIDTGVIGTDAIRVGIVYRSEVLRPVGAYRILDSTVDPRFIDTKNRPSLAQTFEVIATGARFTVVVNHLKSKGSDCNDVGDPDAGDGQGNCAGTREAAAKALMDWIATDPTGSGDRDVLILGDLNSYAMEDSVSAIRAGADDTAGTGDDFTNLIAKYQGRFAHSYVFDGQAGYLDHALASPTMLAQVTGAGDWHINSDEPDILDYDTSFKPPEQEALYEPNQYRTSDHDPVVVGLNLLSYDFSGYQAPVTNPPAVNSVKAGSSVPVKFSLGGNRGLDVLFRTPTSTGFTCESGAPTDVVDGGSAGSSGLQYDAATDTYTYVWKTSKSWTGTCRELDLTFRDGTYRTADFVF